MCCKERAEFPWTNPTDLLERCLRLHQFLFLQKKMHPLLLLLKQQNLYPLECLYHFHSSSLDMVVPMAVQETQLPTNKKRFEMKRKRLTYMLVQSANLSVRIFKPLVWMSCQVKGFKKLIHFHFWHLLHSPFPFTFLADVFSPISESIHINPLITTIKKNKRVALLLNVRLNISLTLCLPY